MRLRRVLFTAAAVVTLGGLLAGSASPGQVVAAVLRLAGWLL